MLVIVAVAAAAVYYPIAVRAIRRATWEGRVSKGMALARQREEAKEDAYDARFSGVNSDRGPGVALSFDDWEVDGWHRFFTRHDIRRLNARVTFYISHPYRLTEQQFAKLKELEALGHEIGYHGYKHRFASRYVQNSGTEKYLADEIEPGMRILEEHGFEPRTFAYPGGLRAPEVDKVLLERFSIVRGTSYIAPEEEAPARKHYCTISADERGKRMVWAYNIDVPLNAGAMSYVLSRVELASKRRRIAVLYGHNITDDKGYWGTVDESDPRYECTQWHEDVKAILEFAHDRGMRFYTMAELE